MSKYHPCSKEFQYEANRIGLTGNQYIQKLRMEGKLPDISKINIIFVAIAIENMIQKVCIV